MNNTLEIKKMKEIKKMESMKKMMKMNKMKEMKEMAGNVVKNRGGEVMGQEGERRVDVEAVLRENAAREAALAAKDDYDPESGKGACGERVRVVDGRFGGELWLPVSMVEDERWGAVEEMTEYVKLRCRHDFEFWAYSCAKIRDKMSGRVIRFKLNHAQRRVLSMLEEDRLAERPLRLIMLKARQWGGSTLIQLYMGWIQCCLRENWNSIICAQVKDAAATIRGMYDMVLSNYPEEYWDGEGRPKMKGFQEAKNTREIAGRGCRVTLATAEKQDGLRGIDVAMAHLTEVAFWRKSKLKNPEGFIRAICGAINYAPLTLIVLESTANGVGNYFHSEWLRAVKGVSDKRPVFVPWHEIEIYRREPKDARALVESMNAEEWDLWHRGLTLSMIQWYHDKRREFLSQAQMMAEYPSTAEEAFMESDRCIFERSHIERMEPEVAEPEMRGDVVAEGGAIVGPDSLRGVKMVESAGGELEVWKRPERGASYVVGVDIGGRSAKSDWSVAVVVKSPSEGRQPEIVAQWRGHCDHDILAWRAARLAAVYNRGLLVFESNTLESESIEGSPAAYVLNQIAEHYPNLYRRDGKRIGFHTNRSTKSQIIGRMIAMARDGGWVERSREAIEELSTYEAQEGCGAYGASDGHHDDTVMARAIAFEAAASDQVVKPAMITDLHDYLGAYRW